MASLGPTLINSYTVGSGGASSVVFNSIPQTYTDLLMKFSVQTNRGTFSSDPIYIYPNGLSSSLTGITLFNANGNVGSNTESFGVEAENNIFGSNYFGNGEVYLTNYSSSSNYKNWLGASAVDSNVSSGQMNYVGINTGLWSSTSAITSITFNKLGSLFNQYSTFYLYGIVKQ